MEDEKWPLGERERVKKERGTFFNLKEEHKK